MTKWVELEVYRTTRVGVELNPSPMMFNVDLIVTLFPDKPRTCKLLTSAGVEYHVADTYTNVCTHIGTGHYVKPET